MAKHEKDDSIRCAAIARLTNRELLEDIAANDQSFNAGRLAVERLTGRDIVADSLFGL